MYEYTRNIEILLKVRLFIGSLQELQEVLEGFGLRANIEELTAVSHLVDIKQDGTIDYYGAYIVRVLTRDVRVHCTRCTCCTVIRVLIFIAWTKLIMLPLARFAKYERTIL